jgi:5-methylcytosine-specific restriction endonuclease McrA
MIYVLQEIDACSGYRELGYTSLSAYMIGALKFSEAGAHHFITVCRKAVKVPELQDAIKRGRITVSKAKTIAPVLTSGNASQWLELARNSTVRELERQVARENPEATKIARIRHRAKDHVDITVTVTEATVNLIQRARELLQQKRRAHVGLAEVLNALAEEFVERNDPLRRAARKPADRLSEREKALLRDKGACQFRLPGGKLCGARHWIDIHHVVPKSEGGAEDAPNLVTLCSAHHRMVHDPPGLT